MAEKRKLMKAEREERDAFHARMLANARRTRALAEKAQAELGVKVPRRPRGARPAPKTSMTRDAFDAQMLANAQRTRALAEKAQAELDAKRASS